MDIYERLNIYPHNIKICEKVREAYEDGEDIVSIIQATGTGKTYIGLYLALKYKTKKALWIVPYNSIKEHIEEIIRNNPNIDMQRDFPNLEIITYTKLSQMTDEEIAALECEFLITDELHHIGAPVWGQKVNTLINTHEGMKVFGMTAYSVRDRGTAYERDMTNPETEEIFSDTVVSTYDIYDAIIDGVLPMPFVKSLLIEDSEIIKELEDSLKLKRIQGKPIYYQIKEVIDGVTKLIHKNLDAKELIQQTIKPGGKYIYFCPVYEVDGQNDMESIMKQIMDYIKEKHPDKKVVFYQTTSEMGEEGKRNRDCFYDDVDLEGNDVSDTIRIMFAKNQYNEGVHAPNIDGVFLGRKTGSDIVALEQIGRGLSVRGDTSKKLDEYNKYSLEELKIIAKDRGISFDDDITKEDLIEMLIAPTIIDLADNISFLEELETNLKDRVRERRQDGEPLTERQLKILESWTTLDIIQKELYTALKNLREEIRAITWDDMYELALAYYNEYHNSEIPQNFKTINGKDYDENGIHLGAWCNIQRVLYNKKKLNTERQQKLEQIEFRFESKSDVEWERKYKLLLEYYNEYGNSNVPQDFKTKNGIKLGNWCEIQRTKKKNGTLLANRIRKLELLGFRFERKRDVEWERKYKLLLAYYEEYKNTDVPKGFITKNGIDKVPKEEEQDEDAVNLYDWCNNQREAKRNEKLDPEREKKLLLLGLRFINKNEIEWERKYKLLLAYYEKYKNTDVPKGFITKNGIDKVPKEEEQDEDAVNLYDWCDTQREAKRNEKLDPEREKKLLLLGLRFINKNEIEWERKYKLLLAYYEKYKNTDVPKGFITKNGIDKVPKEEEQDEDAVNLYLWCEHQRAAKRNGAMDPPREKKLNLLGFRLETNALEIEWERKYKLLLAYYERYKNTDVPDGFITKNGIDKVPKEEEQDKDSVNLYIWCKTQRKVEKDEKLEPERRKKLDIIGFRFISKKDVKIKKQELCSQHNINFDSYKILNRMSYQELYAKIRFLLDNNQPLIINGDLHEIFYMSNENMLLKYLISKEEMITKYYIEHKERGI